MRLRKKIRFRKNGKVPKPSRNGQPIILDEPAYFLAGSFFEISEFCLENFEKNVNLKMDAREP